MKRIKKNTSSYQKTQKIAENKLYSADTLTEQLLDWIPRNTRKLKIAALEFVGVKQLKSNCFVLLLLAKFSIFLPQQFQEWQF